MLQFDGKGIAASDISSTYTQHSGGPMTGGRIGWYSQVVDPAEPATLGVLVKGRKKGRTYAGSITYRALAKVSPWFGATTPFSEKDGTQIRYTLVLGADNLPTKLITSQPASAFFDKVVEPGNARFSTETSYSGWGARVRVTAPPKSETAG